MRTLFFTLALLIAFDVHSQIPDSLEVALPWEIVHVPNCETNVGLVPTTTNSTVFIFQPEIILINIDDSTGNCYKKVLQYTIVDWIGSETYTFQQIIKVDEQYTLNCKSGITITYDDLPYNTEASDLIENADPTHVYSFSPNDESDTSIDYSETDISNGNYEVFIYDHDDRSVCKVNFYLTYCNEEITIDIPEGATIEFEEEPLIPLTLELLDINIDYPCGEYTTKLYHDNQSRTTIFSSSIGQMVELTIEIDFEPGNKYTQTIDLHVTGTPPLPIPMFIEEKEFQAGDVVELDIWSSDLENLAAWGLRLKFENAMMTNIVEGPPFNSIPHNIFNEGKTINTIWTPGDAIPINVVANETWFTLTVIPEIDGNTFDIFSTTNDPWSNIIIEGDEFILEYEADFVMNIAPRNILSSNDYTDLTDIHLIQNPVSETLRIGGMQNFDSESIITLRSIDGQLLNQIQVSHKVDKFSINISQYNPGLYFITIQSKDGFKTLKVIVY